MPKEEFKRCWMRCGKLKTQKQRYIVISRNCLYYYKNSTIETDESILATGVIPLYGLNMEKRMVIVLCYR